MKEEPVQDAGSEINSRVKEFLSKFQLPNCSEELAREITRLELGTEFSEICNDVETWIYNQKGDYTLVCLIERCFDVLQKGSSSEKLYFAALCLILAFMRNADLDYPSAVVFRYLRVLSLIELPQTPTQIFIVKLTFCRGEFLKLIGKDQWTDTFIVLQMLNIFQQCTSIAPVIRECSWETIAQILVDPHGEPMSDVPEPHPASEYIVHALLDNFLDGTASLPKRYQVEAVDFIRRTSKCYTVSAVKELVERMIKAVGSHDSHMDNRCRSLIFGVIKLRVLDGSHEWLAERFNQILREPNDIFAKEKFGKFPSCGDIVTSILISLLEMNQDFALSSLSSWLSLLCHHIQTSDFIFTDKALILLTRLLKVIKETESFSLQSIVEIKKIASSLENVTTRLCFASDAPNLSFLENFTSCWGSQAPTHIEHCFKALWGFLWGSPSDMVEQYAGVLQSCINVVGIYKCSKYFPKQVVGSPDLDVRFHRIILVLSQQRTSLMTFYEYVWPLTTQCRLMTHSKDFYDDLHNALWGCLVPLSWMAVDTSIPFGDPLFVQAFFEALHAKPLQLFVLKATCKLAWKMNANEMKSEFTDQGNALLASLIKIYLGPETVSTRDDEVAGRAIENVATVCSRVIDPAVVDNIVSMFETKNPVTRRLKILHILKSLVPCARARQLPAIHREISKAINSDHVSLKKRGYQVLEVAIEKTVPTNFDAVCEFLRLSPPLENKAEAPRLRCLTRLIQSKYLSKELGEKTLHWTTFEALLACKNSSTKLVRTASFNHIRQVVISLHQLCKIPIEEALIQALNQIIDNDDKKTYEKVSTTKLASALFLRFLDQIDCRVYKELVVKLLKIMQNSSENYREVVDLLRFGFRYYSAESLSDLLPTVLKALEISKTLYIHQNRLGLTLLLRSIGRLFGFSKIKESIHGESSLAKQLNLYLASIYQIRSFPKVDPVELHTDSNLEIALNEMNKLAIERDNEPICEEFYQQLQELTLHMDSPKEILYVASDKNVRNMVKKSIKYAKKLDEGKTNGLLEGSTDEEQDDVWEPAPIRERSHLDKISQDDASFDWGESFENILSNLEVCVGESDSNSTSEPPSKRTKLDDSSDIANAPLKKDESPNTVLQTGAEKSETSEPPSNQMIISSQDPTVESVPKAIPDDNKKTKKLVSKARRRIGNAIRRMYKKNNWIWHTHCAFCKTSLFNRERRILPCLHTIHGECDGTHEKCKLCPHS